MWIVSSSSTQVTIVEGNENHIISRCGHIYFPSILSSSWSSSSSKCKHVQWLSKLPKKSQTDWQWSQSMTLFSKKIFVILFNQKLGEKKKNSLFFAPNAIVLSTSDHDIYIYQTCFQTCENWKHVKIMRDFLILILKMVHCGEAKLHTCYYVEEKTIEAFW